MLWIRNAYSNPAEILLKQLESDCKRQLRKSVYRSPLQLLIDELEDEVHVKSVEFESAKEHLKSLEKKFTNPNIKIDKTKSQCGQCHMRLGHTKRNCELGVCEGPQMCNDLDKHDVEKKQFCDASTTVKNITKDLEKVKQNLHLKKQTYENTCDTFFSKVLPHLVNTNTDKYYPVGSFGLRQLSMGAIHPDIAILNKHYRCIIPKDLDSAARCFGQILEKYQKDNQGPKLKNQRIQSRDSWRRETPQTTATTTTSSTDTSASAPPVQYMPTYGYYPMGPMPMPLQINASPLMMNQRRMPVGSPLPMTVCNPTQSPSFGCTEMDTVGPDAFDDESEYIACLPPKKRKL
ncbi:Hypothetical predicted protein [Mytilus galloprovincialis]|uniref:Uncharacterized protein n=1 Tax=Mytilus galloprovincialis TaxID=29158 RepID=A0A8B6HG88_MYTGA|nr:Hypothetical predicted protein [Mytilus galloprovincialis]